MDNLAFGLSVTVLGLGIVFGLLIVLWLLLTLALRLEGRGRPGGAPRKPPDPAPATIAIRPTDGPVGVEPALVAAIGVAIARHVESGRRRAAPAMRISWPGSLLFASRWVSAGRTRQGQTWRRRPR